ncbi:MAG: hypothetical protein R2824_34525 [Saprospiraceae bacterium]|nr:hypothetical protein [Lewinella sp.]
MSSFITESDLGVANLNVVGFKCTLKENGVASNNVVHIAPGTTLSFDLEWTQTGNAPLFGILAPDLHWHPRVYLEKMGPGDGPVVPIGTYQGIISGAASVDYTDSIKIPTTNLTEGVYKYVVTLNMYKSGHPISIFHSHFEPDIMFEAIVGFP